MGWASGADIFDRVARSLINAHVDEDTKRQVLGEPIDSLQDSDWDTEDESLERFRDDAVIVELFAQRGIHLDPEDDA